MYSYQEQWDIVRKYRVNELQTYRGNCPFCGGRNTFTVTKKQGSIIWNCYRASCPVSGTREGLASVEAVKSRLEKAVESGLGLEVKTAPIRPIPHPLTSVSSHWNIVEWLKDRNSYIPYIRGFGIKYSPTEDRIMFPVYDPTNRNNTAPLGYSGRAIDIRVNPKWLKYGDCEHLFTCGRGDIGVVVEDAPSACAVSNIPDHVGISLLGTSLTDVHKAELLQMGLNHIFVCLDPDASKKGLDMAWSLSGLIDTKFKLIPNDLKYFSSKEIHNILYSNKD